MTPERSAQLARTYQQNCSSLVHDDTVVQIEYVSVFWLSRVYALHHFRALATVASRCVCIHSVFCSRCSPCHFDPVSITFLVLIPALSDADVFRPKTLVVRSLAASILSRSFLSPALSVLSVTPCSQFHDTNELGITLVHGGHSEHKVVPEDM